VVIEPLDEPGSVVDVAEGGQREREFFDSAGGPDPRQVLFVAGPPKNGVQFMVKDSRKYTDETVHNACFPDHAIVKARDFVFNSYAP
jgi:hypothetical protein